MKYEQNGSGVQNLQISEFVETFSILKIVLAVFVLIFIMYTCRQKFTKHRYGEKSSFSHMDYDRSESRTKQDNLPETSSDTLVENEVKKRQVRKKKPRKQNSEYTEESKDEKGATENTETKSTGEENKVVKRRHKAVLSNGPDYDKASYRRVHNSENPDTAGQVEHVKYAKRRNKGLRGKRPPVNYSGNGDGAAFSTDSVKCVTRHNNVVVGSNYPADSHSSRPIRILKRNDIYDPSSTAEQQVNNVVGSNYRADSHNSRQIRLLNRNDIHDPSSTAEQVEDMKRHNNGVPARKDNVMSENPDSSSPAEEVKHVKRRNKTVTSTDANVMSKNPDSASLVEEVKYAKTLGNQNRPGQADHADDSPVKNCASGGVGDVTSHSEHSGVKQRRKSLSNKIKKDSFGTDHKEKASQGETSQGHAKNRSAGRFSGGFPARRWEKPNRDSATVENKPAKDRVRADTTPRRRSFDRKFEKGFRGRGHSEQHRPSPTDNRTTSDELEKSEHECEEERTMQSADVPSDQIGTMDRKDDSAPCECNSSIESLKAPTNISQQTSKDIEVLREQVEVRPGAIQETQFTPEGHIYIDPAVRERIANPKCPVRMPEKPFENLSFRDNTKRENCSKGSTNISRVHGLFGRKWRERLEKQQERQYAEEDAKSEDEFLDIRDNICPTFMIWGVCHRGDRCELRHPSYRYLERPKRTPPNPEPETVHEEAKLQDPHSYAAILEKTKSTEPEEFFNDALREDRLTEGSLEESWPALGSPEQGQNTKVPKAWGPKREAPNVPVVWEPLSTTKKGPWISDERSKKATADQLQIASDELIADTLQADEYAQLDEYDENEDDYNYYYPEQELNEEEYYEHTEETEADSSDTHEEGKAVDEEPFNCSNSSPVIIEQSTEGSEDPAPPKISSICDICMDRPKDATLVCGHRYCYQCALQMRLDERVCAICRRCIVSVIKTYN